MNVFALIAGGFLGTVLRYELGRLIPSTGPFPLATVLINLVGCLFLGWFFTVAANWKIRPDVRIGLGTGFTGAFTTFSTFSVETVGALNANHSGIALAYLLISIVGGLVMVGVGVALGQKSGKKAGGSA